MKEWANIRGSIVYISTWVTLARRSINHLQLDSCNWEYSLSNSLAAVWLPVGIWSNKTFTELRLEQFTANERAQRYDTAAVLIAWAFIAICLVETKVIICKGKGAKSGQPRQMLRSFGWFCHP